MARRIHVPKLSAGELPLDAREAHHAREVLRLPDGTEVEVFDDFGAVAQGVLRHGENRGASVSIKDIRPADPNAFEWTIASAVPKGERADWMVEKLSELGTSAFIPLAAARSVVLPEGKNKRERWMRIATESAKQSRRAGVMRIEELAGVEEVVGQLRFAICDLQLEEKQTPSGLGTSCAWYLSTEPSALPIGEAISRLQGAGSLLLLIGPEGGWTADEIDTFNKAGLMGVRLTGTVLRVETAAIAAAAVVSCLLGSAPSLT